MEKIHMFLRINFLLAAIILALTACSDKTTAQPPAQGPIERLSPKLDALIKPDAKVEILAEGFTWAEGPLWLAEQQMLIFTDVPENRIYSWREGQQTNQIYLEPSGNTSDEKREGANGLLLDAEGRLVLCQHGDRRMARMDAPLAEPKPNFVTLADKYQGKRFNSPNDAAYDSAGNLYFTDPPYGLPHISHQEVDAYSVYRLSASGELTVITDKLYRPNGIAFSPDEKTLYVANSDPKNAVWMAYELNPDGTVASERVFYDATSSVTAENPGVPDGLKVDKAGNVYGSGPGGVWIFSPEGEKLGHIRTAQATANVGFNEDQSALYLTSHMYLLRVVLK
jgi:gluconolactonase